MTFSCSGWFQLSLNQAQNKSEVQAWHMLRLSAQHIFHQSQWSFSRNVS